MWKWAVGLVGLALAAPVLGVLALAVVTPITPSGAAYLVAAALVAGGLCVVPWLGARALWVPAGGVGLALVVAGLRLATVGVAEPGPVRVIVLPADSGTRWLNRLVDEQDVLLFGSRLMRLIGGVSAREHAGLTPALTAGYAELRAVQPYASPVLSTYLFLQRPGAFDAVVVEPEGEAAPTAGVVFLHGFMGNVTLQCWEIAQAARAVGMLTVCPSTGWIGDWWRPGGAATVRATLDYMRDQGIERLYVGGFSNGGVGLSRRVSEAAAEPDVRGLFFIAGVTEAQAIRDTGLPVLILQGAGDERMRAEPAWVAAGVIGDAATYVEIEADHFLIVKEAEAVEEALGGWLGDLDKDP